MAIIDFMSGGDQVLDQLRTSYPQPTTTWQTQTQTPSAPANPLTSPTTTPTASGSSFSGMFGFPTPREAYDRYQQTRPTQAPAPTAPTAGPSPFSGGSFRDWFMGAVQGRPYNQQTLLDLEQLLQQSGSRLTPANAAGERTKIWDPTINDWVRVGFGEGTPVWIPQGWGQNGPQASQFSDPSTAALEQYLQRYLGELDQQRGAFGAQRPGFEARQREAQAATERLIAFMTQRAQQLQGPAYTGAEQEVFRTQALEPIERDRQASKQRALQNIGARGFDPSSGIAQELLGSVDRGADQFRAQAQNQLAYRQIAEQRSRQQEAQALLAAIPQTQRAATQGDLAFIQALDAAMNNYRNQGLGLATQNQQLPSLALRDALAAMGMAPNIGGAVSDQMQYANQQQGQNAQWWNTIGSLLPYLFR